MSVPVFCFIAFIALSAIKLWQTKSKPRRVKGKNNKAAVIIRSGDDLSQLSSGRPKEDFLGKAAAANSAAKAAVKNRMLDDAWRHYHEAKLAYMQHASASGFTKRQALALDGSVHEHLANILRIEGKNDEALMNILYCVSSDTKPTKAQIDKVRTYLNRCKFKNVFQREADYIISAGMELTKIRSIVVDWRKRG